MKFIKIIAFAILLSTAWIVFADSTNVSPTSIQNVMYPSTTNPNPAISTERYDLLPVCPATSALICPDINGKLPGQNTTANCPDYCTVTRALLGGVTIGNMTYYTGSTDAVCPANYAQIATYNMDDEYAYQQSGLVKSGEPNMAVYKNAGWTCMPLAGAGDWPSNANYLGYQGTCKNPIATDGNGWAEGYFGQTTYVYMYDDSDCYFGGNCGGLKDKYCTVSSNRWYRHNLFQVSCYSPPGLYKTGKIAPTSIVCAHVKPTWLQQN